MDEASGVPSDAARAALLEGVLGRVLGQAVRLDAIHALGAVSNRSFVARTRVGSYVVKFRELRAGWVLSPDEEYALMRQAGAAGLAPQALGTDPDSGALVTVYRAGASAMTPEAVREPANVERIADLLGRLHRVPAQLRPLECGPCVRRYIAAAGDAAAFAGAQGARAHECVRLADEYDRRFGAGAPAAGNRANSVACHNDLVSDNILDDGELVLVDFEYAVSALPLWDLASLAAMNGFDADARAGLIRAYYPGAAPFDTADFDTVVRLANLMAHFWALGATAETTDPERFSDFLS